MFLSMKLVSDLSLMTELTQPIRSTGKTSGLLNWSTNTCEWVCTINIVTFM